MMSTSSPRSLSIKPISSSLNQRCSPASAPRPDPGRYAAHRRPTALHEAIRLVINPLGLPHQTSSCSFLLHTGPDWFPAVRVRPPGPIGGSLSVPMIRFNQSIMMTYGDLSGLKSTLVEP